MAGTSKVLLDQPPKPSLLESIVLGDKCSLAKLQQKKQFSIGGEKGRPLTTEVPKSQVLGKIKDFLGVMAKENEKLELNAQGSSRSDYDIEVLNGNEEGYIEMDLLLGVADLYTPEAVAAAEATIGGLKPSVASSLSSSDTEGESDKDSEDDDDDNNANNSVDKLHHDKQGDKPNKRPKIVVLN